MAVKNSVAVTDFSGRSVPAGNIIISAVTFPVPTLNVDAEGKYDGTVTRQICYSMSCYTSVATLQALDNCVQGFIKEFNSAGYTKIMTDAEYTALLAKGELAEVWLKDYIKSVVGGNPTIINPYS